MKGSIFFISITEQFYSTLMAESFDFAPLDSSKTTELVRFISSSWNAIEHTRANTDLSV